MISFPFIVLIAYVSLLYFTLLPYLKRKFRTPIAYAVLIGAVALPISDTLTSVASLVVKCSVQAMTLVPDLDFSSGLGVEADNSLICSFDCRRHLALPQIRHVDNYERTKDGGFDVRRFLLKTDGACRRLTDSFVPDACIYWLDPPEMQARYLLGKLTHDSSGSYQNIFDRVGLVSVFEYRRYTEPPGWLLSLSRWHPASGVRPLSCHSIGIGIPSIGDVIEKGSTS